MPEFYRKMSSLRELESMSNSPQTYSYYGLASILIHWFHQGQTLNSYSALPDPMHLWLNYL